MFEDEMTERHMARTEAEYRAVSRQEIRDQRLADERNPDPRIYDLTRLYRSYRRS